MRCRVVQDQMLEYLYDLLDDVERRELEEHLGVCPSCSDALDQTRRQQSLLAAAARQSFPAVSFEAPREPAPVPLESPAEEPRVLPLPRRRAAPRRRWAVAAAVLLVAGMGTALAGLGRSCNQAIALLERQENVLADASARIRHTSREIQEARNQLARAEAQLLRQEEASQLRLAVTAPATLPAGNRTPVAIATTNLSGAPVAARVDVTLRKARAGGRTETEELLERRQLTQEGLAQLDLAGAGTTRLGESLDLVVKAERDATARAEVVLKDLTVPADGYLAELTTDRPLYQPGDVVHYRALALDRVALTPPGQDIALQVALTSPGRKEQILHAGGAPLLDADGVAILGPDDRPLRGLAVGSFPLEASAPEGEYVLSVREASGLVAPVQRRFRVGRYRDPGLAMKLELDRNSYQPGEEVVAQGLAVRPNQAPVSSRPVAVTVKVGDQKVDQEGKETRRPFYLETDEKGEVPIRFRLPEKIEKGPVSLRVDFDNGGKGNAITREIPVQLDQMDVQMFPEGGTLVAGHRSRVYFRVTNVQGEPVALGGELLEDGKPMGCAVETFSEQGGEAGALGLGVFEVLPRKGHDYHLQVRGADGRAQLFPLPNAAEEGVSLRVKESVLEPGKPVEVGLSASHSAPLVVALYCRDRLVALTRVLAGQTHALLRPDAATAGMCRLTVYREVLVRSPLAPLPIPAAGMAGLAAGSRLGAPFLTVTTWLAGISQQVSLAPVAERLVYREPTGKVRLVLEPDAKSYRPGQRARLSVRAVNEVGEPVPAILQASVVDGRILALSGQPPEPSLPAHFLLGEGLEQAGALLADVSSSRQALDLYLGVYGWRRFVSPEAGKPFRPPQVEELRYARAQAPDIRTELEARRQNLRNESAGAIIRLQARHQEAEQQYRSALQDPVYAGARARVETARHWLALARKVLTPVLAAAALYCAILVLVFAARRQARRSLLSALPGALCGVVLALLAFATIPAPAPAPLEEQHAALPAPPPGEALPGAMQDEAGKTALARDLPATEELGLWEGQLENGSPDVRPLKRGQGEARVGRRQAGVSAAAAAPQEQKAAQRGGGAGGTELARRHLNEFGRLREVEAVAKPKEPAAPRAGHLSSSAVPGRGIAATESSSDDREKERVDAAEWYRMRYLQNQAQAAKADKGAFGAVLRGNVVREYAYQSFREARKALSTDHADTLYWHPALVLPDSGKTTIELDLTQVEADFEVAVQAHTLDGRLGAARAVLSTRVEE